jgi:cobalt-zinc-cadmium efflux system outer membrane protein
VSFARLALPRAAQGTCWRYLLVLGLLPRAASAQELFADSAAIRQIKQAVRMHSLDILAHQAELDVARARLQATGISPAATLGAEVEEVPSGVNLASAGSIRLDLSREFLSGPLRSAQRAVAERDVDRAAAGLALAERSLGARVDRAFTLAVGAVAIARRLAAEDSLLASAEEAVRTRFAVGDARYVDVLRLRTERLRVRTETAAALTEGRVGRDLLAALTAFWAAPTTLSATIDSAVVRELRDPFRVPLPAAPSLDSLLAISAATQLGDIAVARATASRRLVSAQQRPVMAASLGVQRFTTESGEFSAGPTIGATVSLPFTARRGMQAAATLADREIAAAEARRRASVATVRADLSAARRRYEAARERLALFDAALLRGANEERESALSTYRGGQLSLIELLDFERALARAELSRLRSRMDAADALADLIAGAAGDEDDSSAESNELHVSRGDDQ